MALDNKIHTLYWIIILAGIITILALLLEKPHETFIEVFIPLEDPIERFAPHSMINDSDIFVYDDYVVVKGNFTHYSGFQGTKSMVPTFDKGHDAIYVSPQNESDIYIGDIILYENEYRRVHRVIDIDSDDQGWYAITMGDSTDIEDPNKVRFEHIEAVMVIIIY